MVNEMDEISTLLKGADGFLNKEKYIDAIREYLKATDLVKDSDKELLAEIYYKISQAYSAIEPKNIENSMKYAQMSLDIHTENQDKDLQVVDRLNIFYILHDAGKTKESEVELDRALATAKETGENSLINMVLLARAEFLSGRKSAEEELLRIYRDVLETSGKDGDWESYFEARRGLIENIRTHGGLDDALMSALKALDEIDEISSNIKNKKERKEFRTSLSYMYDMASDIAMEMENVDKAIQIAQRLSEKE
jgi:tetratricopeptide (TPR) repeat protein